jgi:hypothetical protein
MLATFHTRSRCVKWRAQILSPALFIFLLECLALDREIILRGQLVREKGS